MSAVNDLTEERLRALAQSHAAEQTVISLYLDLDPAHFATAPARETEIVSLLDRARREAEGPERPQSELLALRSGLDRARELLLDGDRSWAPGARSLALFVCQPLELEQLLRLPQSIQSAAVISDVPFIAPLAEVGGPPSRVCVALVDERHARILRGSEDSLREVISFGDPVHGRHDQGGWSQARYQRSQQEDVAGHLRHVAAVLRDLLRTAPYDRLLVASAEPLWARLLSDLHPDVRARLCDQRLSLDVPNASVEDALRAAAPLLAAERHTHEDELLEQLRERHGRQSEHRVAVGLRDVLHALVERRVQALLYDAQLHSSGVNCPRCGWMDSEPADRCPVDGEPLQPRANILEDAVQSALNQSAEVLALRDRPELGPLHGVAATLRF